MSTRRQFRFTLRSLVWAVTAACILLSIHRALVSNHLMLAMLEVFLLFAGTTMAVLWPRRTLRSDAADSQRVIYIAGRPEQAHLLKNALEDRGITAMVSGAALQGAGGELPMGSPTAPRVVVRQRDAEAARQIALDFDAAMRDSLLRDDVDVEYGAREYDPLADPEEDDDQTFDAWPVCPHCQRQRLTECPACETAGTDFPRAFQPGVPSEEPSAELTAERPFMVLCPTCDELFAPTYPNRCEWCGHRFRDGYEAPALTLSSANNPDNELNVRAWILIIGMTIVLGGTLLLFRYIAPNN